MKKLLLLFLVLASTNTFLSCQSDSSLENKGVAVDLVFEEWHFQFGQLNAMDIKMSGKNKSGKLVEAKVKLRINQYDEFLLPTLVKLEEENQFKKGATGSGKLVFNKEANNGKIFIKKVGSMATENMEFFIEEDVVALFKK